MNAATSPAKQASGFLVAHEGLVHSIHETREEADAVASKLPLAGVAAATGKHFVGDRYRGKKFLGERTPALTTRQRAALLAYAVENGREWKSTLLLDWTFSRARVRSPQPGQAPGTREDYRAELQQVRNALGPSWLTSQTVETITEGKVRP